MTQTIFSENNYVNAYDYFYQKIGTVPSRYVYKDVNLDDLLLVLNDKFSSKTLCKTSAYNRKKSEYKPSVSLFEISGNIILGIIDPPYNELLVEILFVDGKSDESIINDLQALVISCLKNKEDFKGQLHVMSGNGHFYFEKFDIKAPEINIKENYNDDFVEIDSLIKEELDKENNKGIIILHGEPGTGKTFYVRHLIASLKKQKLYIPPNLAEQIASPSFISVLEDNSNSILIIEDAENILEKRSAHSGSAVSNLLNLSDGLLADCFNIQIICTFNSALSNIDEALLRKGRLIAQYEFKPLEVSKAQQLSDKVGNTEIITKPMTLTEVYNLKAETGVKTKKKKMGFV